MHRILMRSAAVWAALATPASVIFTNLGPGSSYDTTGGNPIGNDLAGDNAAQGNTFTQGSTAALGSLDIALSCSFCTGSGAESFTVDLTTDSSGTPGTILESFAFNSYTLNALGGNNPLIVANSVAHPILTAGTAYWITVSTSSTANAITWNWNSTGDTSNEAISTDGGSSWFAPSGLTPGAYQVN